MGTCFVIQPFDKGAFDKRYEDVLAPAIRDADLEPYRVDRDPGVTIPIQDIEEGIRRADVCIADISTENPNVWFELGYAIAAKKEVVLLCLEQPGRRFPFDVQHRAILQYQTESDRDFQALRTQISARLKAILAKGQKLGSIPIADVEGLAPHEIATLVSIASTVDHPTATVSTYAIREDMARAGYKPIAVTLALRALTSKGMVELREDFDRDGDPYPAYSAAERGLDWLLHNQALLVLKEEPAGHGGSSLGDDDIPF